MVRTKKYLLNEIKRTKAWIEQAENNIRVYESKLEYLERCTSPTLQELYKNIENYFDYSIVEDKDGNNTIAVITIKDGFFLNSDQRDVVEGYVKRLHDYKLLIVSFRGCNFFLD